MTPTFVQTPPSPLQRLQVPYPVEFYLKRDDLLALGPDDPLCGNKWRKLLPNIERLLSAGLTRLLTFGGAYSNHIAAVASAGQHYGLDTIGMIRGELVEPLNPTLSRAKRAGMTLVAMDRESYRHKEQSEQQERLLQEWGPCLIVPEGGTNQWARQGAAAIIDELEGQLGRHPDVICVSCGTGGTMAGLIEGTEGRGAHILGISALKGRFLEQEIRQQLSRPYDNWSLHFDAHFGGYAKWKPPLLTFINHFRETYDIQLEPLYTGKMMAGLFDLLAQGVWPEGSLIVALHTGGLQGLEGFRERFGPLV